MELLGYSERGLVNGLLHEIVYRDAPAAQALLGALLQLADWPDASPPKSLLDRCATVLVEQSFSDFGDADAVFLLNDGMQRAAIFCEAKRGLDYTLQSTWSKFIDAFQTQCEYKGLTSNLFCQLYFKQRLARSLDPAAGENADAGLVFEPPFGLARRLRTVGANQVVQRAVAQVRNHCPAVFYLMLIPEEWTPQLKEWWRTKVVSCSPAPRHWDVSRWGAITIPQIAQFCDQNRLNRTLATIEHNDGQLYLKPKVGGNAPWPSGRKLRGVSIIYAPSINPDTCLHFSWDREGCALRNYCRGASPNLDRSRTSSEVFAAIKKDHEHRYSARTFSVGQVADWQRIIDHFNQLWVMKPS